MNKRIDGLDSFLYATKLWATGVLVSPFLYITMMKLFFIQGYGNVGTQYASIIYFWFFGFLLSLPSWIALCIVTWITGAFRWPLMIKKIPLILLSVFATIIPFESFQWEWHMLEKVFVYFLVNETSQLVIPYLATIIAGLLYFQWERTEQPTFTTEGI